MCLKSPYGAAPSFLPHPILQRPSISRGAVVPSSPGHGSDRVQRLFHFSRGKLTRAADVEILWARAPAGNMGGVGGVMLFLRAKLW